MAKISFEELRGIINKHDPIRLISDGAPEDEYDPEVKEILESLDKCKDFRDVLDLVYNTFDKYFGAFSDATGKIVRKDKKIVGSKDRYRDLAKDIFSFLEKLNSIEEAFGAAKGAEPFVREKADRLDRY